MVFHDVKLSKVHKIYYKLLFLPINLPPIVCIPEGVLLPAAVGPGTFLQPSGEVCGQTCLTALRAVCP